MSRNDERLVGALFRVLAEEGHTEARELLLETYRAEAAADREELAESLFVELMAVLDEHLEPREEVDVLTTAVEYLVNRFSAVIETAPVAIAVVGPDGAIQLWNDGAERMFGWSEASVHGESYPAVLAASPDEPERFLDRLRDGERLTGVETRHRRKDGSVVDVRVWAAPLRDRSGGFAGGAFVVSDVTAQKQREQRLAVLNRVLRHNIRNDVTVIRGHLEMLADELPDGSDHVRVIDQRLADVVELSDAARKIERLHDESGAELAAFDLRAVVRERIDRLQSEHPAAEIRTALSEDVTAVAHELLPYALENVFENALEHNASETPVVAVTVTRPSESDAEAVVRVADNGPGLPETEREVLLSDRETPLRHSAGLGLWLTRWIVRSSDGTVVVDDSDLGGTAVEVRLRTPTE